MLSVELDNYLSITYNVFIIIRYTIKILKNDITYVLVSTVKIVHSYETYSLHPFMFLNVLVFFLSS